MKSKIIRRHKNGFKYNFLKIKKRFLSFFRKINPKYKILFYLFCFCSFSIGIFLLFRNYILINHEYCFHILSNDKYFEQLLEDCYEQINRKDIRYSLHSCCPNIENRFKELLDNNTKVLKKVFHNIDFKIEEILQNFLRLHGEIKELNNYDSNKQNIYSKQLIEYIEDIEFYKDLYFYIHTIINRSGSTSAFLLNHIYFAKQKRIKDILRIFQYKRMRILRFKNEEADLEKLDNYMSSEFKNYDFMNDIEFSSKKTIYDLYNHKAKPDKNTIDSYKYKINEIVGIDNFI